MTKKVGFIDTNSQKENNSSAAKNRKPTMANKVARKQALQTRKDVADWKWCERLYY